MAAAMVRLTCFWRFDAAARNAAYGGGRKSFSSASIDARGGAEGGGTDTEDSDEVGGGASDVLAGSSWVLLLAGFRGWLEGAAGGRDCREG